jgi:hypothetical protein
MSQEGSHPSKLQTVWWVKVRNGVGLMAFITAPPNGLLPWTVFKDALVFTCEGNKSIGLRLRDDLDRSTRSAIEANFGRDLNWNVFRMPVTTAFSGLSMPGQELLIELQKQSTFWKERLALGRSRK